MTAMTMGKKAMVIRATIPEKKAMATRMMTGMMMAKKGDGD
jgi:hypothetical protein